MWSDPIENALQNARSVLDEVQRGTIKPDATRVSWVIGALDEAIRARDFETSNQKLLDATDRW